MEKLSAMRTSTSRVRGLGSARSGTEHFWATRVTAVANVPLTFAFVVILFMLAGRDYAGALALVGSPAVAILIIAFVLSACVHMRLGMQVIIEDYVHHEGAKVLMLMGNTFFSVLVGLASVYSVLKIGFGS
jgi:succinate dehydrogenase / fumarate reductase, membrane anchor subunit